MSGRTGRKKSLVWFLVPVALLVFIGVYMLLGNARRDARPEGPSTPRVVTDELVTSEAGAQGDKETQRPNAPQPITSRDVDELIDDVMEQVDEEMKTNAEIELGVAANMEKVNLSQNAVWRKEDEVYLRMPKYDEVRDKILEKADELLASIDGDGADAIAQLAQEQLDAFWDKGSLAEEEAYVHAWLARAVLELALEKDPENFHLLSLLKEAIGSVTLRLVKGEDVSEAFLEVWPVVEKQEKLIRDGKVAPSPEVMVAMMDWIHVAPRAKRRRLKITIPAHEWMIDNAEACGWGELKAEIEEGLGYCRKGTGFFWKTPYLLPAEGGQAGLSRWAALKARHERRPCVLRGSREYREKTELLWEVYGTDKVTTAGP